MPSMKDDGSSYNLKVCSVRSSAIREGTSALCRHLPLSRGLVAESPTAFRRWLLFVSKDHFRARECSCWPQQRVQRPKAGGHPVLLSSGTVRADKGEQDPVNVNRGHWPA